ncbi:MAG: phospho-sugar mutase, partial [Christensenellales bacterium]
SGTKVRDKDAILAALMTAEVAAYYSLRGMTLLDGLEELFQKFGYYLETVKSYTLYGAEGMAKIAAAMEGLRKNPPEQIFDRRIQAVRDYSEGFRLQNGEKTPIDLPKSNVLYYELGGGDWLCVRPSGTEPKLKVYAGASESTKEGAKQRVESYVSAANTLLGMD